MVIPWVKIVWISDEKGYGLIASRPIPKGTITFAQDGLDIVITEKDFAGFDRRLMEYVEKYSYEDFVGNRIISWDLGKYMNHDDQANTLSTGYGFEVAIRDIAEGEEVTDDYRIFSTHHNTSDWSFVGSEKNPVISYPEDLQSDWDKSVKSALKELVLVEQPLKEFLSEEVWKEMVDLQKSSKSYRSVSEAFPLRYKLMMAVSK